MKPYLKAQAIPLPRSKDRRVFYSEIDREDVRRRHKEGESMRAIARDTGISRRLIQFWLFPEKLEAARKYRKENPQISHNAYKREQGKKWNARARELKNRKYKLYKRKTTS